LNLKKLVGKGGTSVVMQAARQHRYYRI